MTVGFIMLVHEPLRRAREVARHWARSCCPLVIHIDKNVSAKSVQVFQQDLAEFDHVRFCARRHCEWGTWSLVGATQDASRLMLDAFPEVQHVFLASGTCLPLRPTEELVHYLSTHGDTDFIESVTTKDVPWTIGGLDSERFNFKFPFSWKRRRALFDLSVRLQRLIRYRRKIPSGIRPHLGSQWWCLTRQTLTAILNDPRRNEFDAYFRRVWIPDESYFQTLARLHTRKIESRSLTLSKFDFQGKPHVFYDDHLQLLRRSDCFVARKIWPNADQLYESFLGAALFTDNPATPNPGLIDRVFARASERRTRGRAGLYMHSRFPSWEWENGKTAAPYGVFSGFGALFEDFQLWLARSGNCRAHGHLFAPDRVEFADASPDFAGGLTDSSALRDYNPTAFLANLLWNTRGERQCFLFGPHDDQEIAEFVAGDPNALISVVSGAWAVPLSRSGSPFDDIRQQAALYQKTEAKFLERLRAPQTRARVRIWTMAEFLANPAEHLHTIVADLVGSAPTLHEPPRLADLQGFGQFLQDLKNDGMNPHLMGEFPVIEPDPTGMTAATQSRSQR